MIEDEHVMQLIADALGAQDMPSFVRDSARRAWAWRAQDAALAELVLDSSVTVGMRDAGGTDRILVFEHGLESLEVFVRLGTQTAHRVRLTLDPAVDANFRIEVARVAHELEKQSISAAGGEADVSLAGDAPVRVVVESGRNVWTTPWFRLIE